MELSELLAQYKAKLEAKRIENKQIGASAGAQLHELDALRNNLVVELNIQIGKSLGEIAQLEQVIADLEVQLNAQKPTG